MMRFNTKPALFSARYLNKEKLKVGSLFLNRRKCERVLSKKQYSGATNSNKITPGPSLKDFIHKNKETESEQSYLTFKNKLIRKVFIETYGCQMNFSDTEVALSILLKNGFIKTNNIKEADVILVMTCSIRESAEDKIWKRLIYYKEFKKRRSLHKPPMKIGLLGCMAERLKTKILEKEKMVDLVCGPDAYRDLPRLLAITESNQSAANVQLSLEETYSDVSPVRLNPTSKSAFVSIMRGCDNMCTYCIVPFTRGRERSRPIESICCEIKNLAEQGVKEVVLLGQNVNSYRDLSQSDFPVRETNLSDGFKTIYKTKKGGMRFSDLLEKVSSDNPEMRIRFTSPHPKDFPDDVLYLIKERPNICNSIHLPAQSGNNLVLENMRRGYTREAYLKLVDHIRGIIPDIAFTSDFISGFCGESEEAHSDTLSLIEQVRYAYCYCYMYSMREKTRAFHRLQDDVPLEVKKRRQKEVADTFRKLAADQHNDQIGQVQLVLVEGNSKRSENDLYGRNDRNIKVVFPNTEIVTNQTFQPIRPGDYVTVKITDCNSQTLKGMALSHSSISQYYNNVENDVNIS